MAQLETQQLNSLGRGLKGMSLQRQILFWLVLAGSLTLAVAIIVWAWSPRYSHLGYTISARDAGPIMQTLGARQPVACRASHSQQCGPASRSHCP
jgi:flagellar biosynthesis/type III secretory pathway M-ring protein FliF/YscJ